jgi:YidC/Oxa1 family membrane protein insertase
MDKRSLLFIVCISLSFFAIQAWMDGNKTGKPEAVPVQKDKTVSISDDLPSSEKRALHSGYPSQGQLYVLENEYQQLVFSTTGGSLSELNLPIEAPANPKSLVKKIEPDRLIAKESPFNARFPLQNAHWADGLEPSVKDYYPLLRRTIYDANGSPSHILDPKYYCLNIVGEDPAISEIEYRIQRFEKNLIQLEGNYDGRQIVKTFTIPEKGGSPYCFEMSIQIDGDAHGLWLSSGVPEVELISQSFTPLLRYQVARSNELDIETIEISDKNPVETMTSVSPRWISNSNGFFGIIIDPLTPIGHGYRASKIPGASVPTRLSLIDAQYRLYPPEKYPGYQTFLPLKSGTQTFRIFAGPYDESLLKKLDKLYENPAQNYNPEYVNAQSIQGWFSFISQPFSKFLYILLQFFYLVSHSWGLSIILLTIALRLMMYPLNNWSIRSTLRMQEIAPKVKAIQDRYKKDPKKGQLEVLNLYRQQGINPFSGCLPMLLQMPFLIGMFYLLKSTFPLRGAVFVPGWIDNLAAPDVLFNFGYPLIFIGNELHLLPILLGMTMFWQQKLTAKMPKDVKSLSDSQKQQKMIGNIMSVVFTVMFYGFPSGLNIYFISSTLLGIAQQIYITRKKIGVVK